MFSYMLQGVLGHGNFATVYRAARESSNELFAIKVLAENHSQNGDTRRRFEAESRVLAALAGDGAVTIVGVGVLTTGQPFFIMELADQGSLQEALDGNHQRILAPAAVSLMTMIAGSLIPAHRKGLVHRDLKPANILFKSDSSELGVRVLLSDFGLARALAEASRLTTVVAGTYAYMAPEQFAGRADLRCDTYALGVLLYQLIVGRLPFEQGDAFSLMRAKESESFPAPSSIVGDVPHGVSDLIVRSLAADPDRRPVNAINWAEDVARSLQAISPRATEKTINGLSTPINRRLPVISDDPRHSFMGRSYAIDQLRSLRARNHRGQMTSTELSLARAEILAGAALYEGSPQIFQHTVSPISQDMAWNLIGEFASLKDEGGITESEFRALRGIILREQRLKP